MATRKSTSPTGVHSSPGPSLGDVRPGGALRLLGDVAPGVAVALPDGVEAHDEEPPFIPSPIELDQVARGGLELLQLVQAHEFGRRLVRRHARRRRAALAPAKEPGKEIPH